MDDQDANLVHIANNAAVLFKAMGWKWGGHDSNRTMYIPGPARIVLTLVRLLKDLKDDPAIVSAASGRFIVRRESEFTNHFQISIDLGTREVGEESK